MGTCSSDNIDFLRDGDVIFTSVSWPIFFWQYIHHAPNPSITHSAILIGNSIFEASPSISYPKFQRQKILGWDPHIKQGSDLLPFGSWYKANVDKGRKFLVLRPKHPKASFTEIFNAILFWYAESYSFQNVLTGRADAGLSTCSVSVAKVLTYSGQLDLSARMRKGPLYPGQLYELLLREEYTPIDSQIVTDSVQENGDDFIAGPLRKTLQMSYLTKKLDIDLTFAKLYEECSQINPEEISALCFLKKSATSGETLLGYLNTEINEALQAIWKNRFWEPTIHIRSDYAVRTKKDLRTHFENEKIYRINSLKCFQIFSEMLSLRNIHYNSAASKLLAAGIVEENSLGPLSHDEAVAIFWHVLCGICFGSLASWQASAPPQEFELDVSRAPISKYFSRNNGDLNAFSEYEAKCRMIYCASAEGSQTIAQRHLKSRKVLEISEAVLEVKHSFFINGIENLDYHLVASHVKTVQERIAFLS